MYTVSEFERGACSGEEALHIRYFAASAHIVMEEIRGALSYKSLSMLRRVSLTSLSSLSFVVVVDVAEYRIWELEPRCAIGYRSRLVAAASFVASLF